MSKFEERNSFSILIMERREWFKIRQRERDKVNITKDDYKAVMKHVEQMRKLTTW